ncbi:keratin, type II cytoskeletal 2 epidermal-like [Iris pallida]|uniref:Keratin, type II cytoskeletal 2 epidermal-like n=1 Tax=Iris pallida TaxID=29817 RepID=A0AAX6EHP2_IRIPA|nr:keratin, type II cytoskeletal 2 epidermal-like [Iris pallida]
MGKGVPNVSSCGDIDPWPQWWAPSERHSGSRESSPALALARRQAAGLALVSCWQSCEARTEQSSGETGSRARTAWKGGRHGNLLYGVGSETATAAMANGFDIGRLSANTEEPRPLATATGRVS